MKKKLFIALVMVLCLGFSGSTLALEPDSDKVSPDSILSVLSPDCGLTSNGGGSYTAWASVSSTVSETLTITVKLYRVVGSTLTLITSGSNTVTGTYAYISKNAT